MTMQEIKGEDYTIQYDMTSNTVKLRGELALGSPKEYVPINDLLYAAVDSNPEVMIIDLKELGFLNSSGISMLSKFVLKLRKNTTVKLVVLGSNEMPWQGKSLKNLQKFLPSLRLELE